MLITDTCIVLLALTSKIDFHRTGGFASKWVYAQTQLIIGLSLNFGMLISVVYCFLMCSSVCLPVYLSVYLVHCTAFGLYGQPVFFGQHTEYQPGTH